MFRLASSLLILLLFASPAPADTHACADCEQATVAQAISDAADGDTITIPADSCEWSSGVVVPDAKDLTITGAGTGSTVITATFDGMVIDLGYSGSEISGIYLVLSGGTSSIGVRARGHGGSVHTLGWLVHDMKIESTAGLCEAVRAAGGDSDMDLRGVIFQNTFIDTKPVVFGNLDMDVASQSPAWYTDSVVGTANNVFIEGNTITRSGGNCVDSNYGGKYVFRYNTCTGCYAEAHSVQGDYRACRSWEIYNNQFNGPLYMAFIRGGTGVMFNNKSIYSGAAPVIALDNVRSFESRGTYAGQCDGDSTFDMNDVEAGNGWPCRDQIGRGKDAAEWTDPEAQGPDQASEPAYFWNNTVLGGGGATISIVNNCGNWIQLNRDYFASAKSGYTAYQCPHPATGLKGHCDSRIAGTGGYNLSYGKATVGSGNQHFTTSGTPNLILTVH